MLDEKAQVDLLQGLLRRYSPTLAEAPAVEYLAGWMAGLGYSVQVDAQGSVIGSLGDGPREIILLGHIDTVPGEIRVHGEGDLLYGRGSVDAKGSLACFTSAAVLAGAKPGWRVTVIGAVGEEGDARGAQLIAQRPAPQYCVIGEPSRWDKLTLGYKGSAWYAYTVRRPLSHTAAQAESSAEAVIRFWNCLQEARERFNTGRERAFDQITASLREMQAGSDGFADTADLRFNLRLPPGLTLEELAAWISTITCGEGTLKLLDGIECYRADKNTPLVRAMLSAIRAEGGKPGFVIKTGTSDMNIVGPAWRCPILAYGPGDSSLDHTPDEHISVKEYLTAIRVLRKGLENLFSS